MPVEGIMEKHEHRLYCILINELVKAREVGLLPEALSGKDLPGAWHCQAILNLLRDKAEMSGPMEPFPCNWCQQKWRNSAFYGRPGKACVACLAKYPCLQA